MDKVLTSLYFNAVGLMEIRLLSRIGQDNSDIKDYWLIFSQLLKLR